MNNHVDKVVLDYGRTGLDLYLDRALADWDIIAPKDQPPPGSIATAFAEAAENPISADSLRKVLSFVI